MLTDSLPLSFKEAVFLTENAYNNNQLSYQNFNSKIKTLAELCKKIAAQGDLLYDETDKANVRKYWAVFAIMKDSITFTVDSTRSFKTLPYLYDFDDFWGEKDWSKMFVSKLLNTRTGNCHSLPFLYKILCEELGVPAWLAMAPNHTYIKLWTEKIGWFNTELTSGYFPIDAWIMASGYIHLNAVQNRIYMDTLSNKQSIAVCLTDLAKGYERKFGESADLDFILKCANMALDHYPLFVNALLLKAETMKKKFEKTMKVSGAKHASELFFIPESKALFDEMEILYFHIYKLGYRTMPKEMYISWLDELQQEKDKYTNQRLISHFKALTPNPQRQ